MSYYTPHTARGFTLFFAMLAASLALSVGLAIFDLTARQIELSGAATQSQFAIYSADMGAECALYWDYKYTNAGTNNNGGSGSAFATSSLDTLEPATGAGLLCNGQDITLQGPPAVDSGRYDAGCTTGAWCTLPGPSASAATTTFRVGFSPEPYCAVVEVAKYTLAGIQYTTIVSRGYNTCVPGPTRFERALQLSY